MLAHVTTQIEMHPPRRAGAYLPTSAASEKGLKEFGVERRCSMKRGRWGRV
ncbi:hypothetical protein MJ575_21380 [Klebsiella pneumoniae]|nr:hypothetical protein MJ575_21380 [Klebsiella pneumoniae]